jgi:hypothetical protein
MAHHPKRVKRRSREEALSSRGEHLPDALKTTSRGNVVRQTFGEDRLSDSFGPVWRAGRSSPRLAIRVP